MHKNNVSKGFIKGLYKGNICKTQNTNENHIKPKPKICISILGNIYNKTKNISNNVNNILLINEWTNKTVELDIKTVFTILCQLYAKQLGIAITSCIICI